MHVFLERERESTGDPLYPKNSRFSVPRNRGLLDCVRITILFCKNFMRSNGTEILGIEKNRGFSVQRIQLREGERERGGERIGRIEWRLFEKVQN